MGGVDLCDQMSKYLHPLENQNHGYVNFNFSIKIAFYVSFILYKKNDKGFKNFLFKI